MRKLSRLNPILKKKMWMSNQPKTSSLMQLIAVAKDNKFSGTCITPDGVTLHFENGLLHSPRKRTISYPDGSFECYEFGKLQSIGASLGYRLNFGTERSKGRAAHELFESVDVL